jgi:hypothetical protein
MRTARPFLAAVVLLALAAPAAMAGEAPPAPPAPSAGSVVGDGACGCCPPRDPCRRSHLEIQGHVSLLTEDPEGLVSADSGTPGQLRWDDVDYDVAFGGRVAWTFPWDCWDVTVAGTWWGSWDGDAQSTGSLAASQVPGGPLQVSPQLPFGLSEEATLWDVNLTFTKPFVCKPCFTAEWGWGVRYLRFDEQSRFTFDPTSYVDMDIENGLLAAEGVVTGTWRLSSCWDVRAGLSLFAGWMHRSGTVTQPAAPGLFDPERDEDDVGFGGEIEAALRWHPSSCWTLSLGYGLLALGNVTRGHDALDAERQGTLDFGPIFRDDVILVHRVFLGIGLDL